MRLFGSLAQVVFVGNVGINRGVGRLSQGPRLKKREEEMGRKWIKLYCYERLHGSITYQLTEPEQSVWDKILCLAGLSRCEGLISDNDMRAYPHSFIIHELHTTEKIFESLLAKCKKEGRLAEDDAGIHIVNWPRYQSEYQRQKPYRQSSPAQQPLSAESLPDLDLALFTILEQLPTFPKDRDVAKLEELLTDYPGLNYHLEFKKFIEWWSKHKLKSPWLALRNWLEKATKIGVDTEEGDIEQEWKKYQRQTLQENSPE